MVDKEIQVSVINRREIAKIILKECGNEGVEDDKEHANTRRLLQHALDYLPKEKDSVWKNAEISIFDIGGNIFSIRSGDCRNKFMVHNNGKDELEVINTQREPFYAKPYNWFMERWTSGRHT
ncbi:hypothetical protein ScPMuIL_013348 [Solemya velum]